MRFLPFRTVRRGPNQRVRNLLLVLCVILALPLVSCRERARTKHEEGVAVVVPVLAATFIRNFNPFFQTQSRWPSTAGIYEPTIVFNRATGKFVPWLAEEWWWQDENKRLVLKIREGVKWSDGKPLTANDVAFTFRLMEKFDALDQSSIWTHLSRIEVHDRNVHFFFKHPFTTPVLDMIGQQPIVPEHIWKEVEDPVRFPNENPVGSGPFNQLLSFKPQMYEVGANPNYWQKGKPGLKKFRLPAIGGNEAQALALIGGDIDWSAAFLPAIDRIFVAKDPEHHGYFFPSLEGTVMLYANTKREPFDSVEVRKAISHAIDRKLIVRIAMQNYTRVADATGLSDLYQRYHDPKVLEEEGDFTIYDPKKAEAMLDAAGLKRGKSGYRTLPDGSPFVMDLNCVVGWSDWIIAAEIMVNNLRAVGLDVTLRTYAFGAWFNKLQTGNFQLSMSWSDGGATPWSFYLRQMSADSYRPIGESADNNWQRFVSPKADELLTAFASTSDLDEQKRLASELQREFVRKAPAIPLFPGPTWGQFNSTRIVGFPSKKQPYAPLAPYKAPGQILTMVELHPRGTPPVSSTPGQGAPGRGLIPYLGDTEAGE
jgi:peptide/nickel transport system substrate-binding protein